MLDVAFPAEVTQRTGLGAVPAHFSSSVCLVFPLHFCMSHLHISLSPTTHFSGLYIIASTMIKFLKLLNHSSLLFPVKIFIFFFKQLQLQFGLQEKSQHLQPDSFIITFLTSLLWCDKLAPTANTPPIFASSTAWVRKKPSMRWKHGQDYFYNTWIRENIRVDRFIEALADSLRDTVLLIMRLFLYLLNQICATDKSQNIFHVFLN